MPRDYEIFELGDVPLQRGATLKNARLAYKTYGTLDAAGSNVVVFPTFFTGTHIRNEEPTSAAGAPSTRRVISSCRSISSATASRLRRVTPSQGQDGPHFPTVTVFDNVVCQHRLLTTLLGVKRIALVAGWSLAGIKPTKRLRSTLTW